MLEDGNGFLFPILDEKNCIDCGLCEKSCPIINPLQMPKHEPKAYAAYSKNEAIRLDSSSGGIFTELARMVFQRGGVVFAAAYNEKFDVVHVCAENEEELAKLRGAKYAQSDLRGVFTQVKARLRDGQLVLFFGTPCQVGGLKSFLRKSYENLLTVDCVCHSVPSPMAWREYVKYRAAHDNDGGLPTSINLRSKKTGWSRYQYSNLFQYESGTDSALKTNESLFMKLFVGGYINRESCQSCQFKGYSRVSDLTLGDFWGIWDIAPAMDDDKGTSVVLVQSEAGAAILEQIAPEVIFKPVSLEDASSQNPAMLRSSAQNPRRGEALGQIKAGEMGDLENWFPAPERTSVSRLKGLARRILGKLGKK